MNARSTRRHVLRGAGIAVALPALSSLFPRRAGAAESPSSRPRRFVAFFTGNGHPDSLWASQGPESDFTLPTILKPLAPHRANLVPLQGLSLRASGTNGHAGVGTLLTGTRPGAGVSVDQALAAAATTRLRSLELGVMLTAPAHPIASPQLSYTGAGRGLIAEEAPARVYERLFSEGACAAVPATLKRRRSVLDAVNANLARVRRQVDASDRVVLDAHAQGIRDLEIKLAGVCAPPNRPPTVADDDPARATTIRDLQIDLLALALASDATRVASLVIGGPDATLTFPFLPLGTERNVSWSALSDRTDGAAITAHAHISAWCAEGLARLVSRLKESQEGDGSVFDTTTILWGTECNRDHRHDDIPLLLAAGPRSGLRTGRLLRFATGTPHNPLLVSIMRAMGRDVRTFGDPALNSGALPGLA